VYRLLCDIKSNFKKHIYGRKGDEVRLIAISGDVAIVEGRERFPVRIEYITTDDVNKEEPQQENQIVKPVQAAIRRKSARPAPKKQEGSLLLFQ